ncbi:MAG TPA: hypothetical protein VEB22_12010 [Phycisphaerales bacterium]|nr:hypothetical protein [Phycisphaerales bacterium]
MNAARLLPSRAVASAVGGGEMQGGWWEWRKPWIAVPFVLILLAALLAAVVLVCWLIRAAGAMLFPSLAAVPLAGFVGVLGGIGLLLHIWWPQGRGRRSGRRGGRWRMRSERQPMWVRVGATLGALLVLFNGVVAALDAMT